MFLKKYIKNKKIGLFLGLLIIMISTMVALTGVIQIDTFFDSSTGEALTGVRSLQFTCNDNECNDIGTQTFDLNSGTTNQITFEYSFNPSSTVSNQDYYAHYFFKQCYLPKEFVEHVFGFGATLEFDYNFNKASSCHSPIDSFSVTNSNFVNEPVTIDVKAILEADAHSAFTNLLLDFIPAGFESFYSVETKITIEVTNDDTGNVVFTDTQISEILMDTSQNFQFEFTPTVEGNYTARIKTDVIDCKCQSSFEQFSERNFVVLKERPKNQCYTIINDLEAVPEFAEEGDNVIVRFNKISNFADNSFVKTPVKTRVTYEITDSQNNVVFSDNLLLNANANGIDPEEISFNFVPNFGGDFNIKVTGISESSLCDGKPNTKDTAILGFFVKSKPVHKVTFVVSDSQTNLKLENAEVNFGTQTGNTDSSGKVVFNSNTGNFSFSVSLTDYETETGTEEITGDVTINVALDLLIVNPPICGNNIVETGEQCDDGNLINGDGCSSICQIEIIAPVCGNNIIETGEQCDDGNTINGDGCSSTCQIEDDDGNTINGDGCSSTCQIEDDDGKDDRKNKKSKKKEIVFFCEPSWECSGWSECFDGATTRNCQDINHCKVSYNKPIEKTGCEMPKVLVEESNPFNFLLFFGIFIFLILILILIVSLRKP